MVDFTCTLVMLLFLSKFLFQLQERVIGAIENLFPSWDLISLPPLAEGILITILSMLAYDFATYVMHRMMHHNPLLWRIHAFHHSAKTLTFFTTFRQHPLEPVLLALARSTAVGLCLALFHCFFSAGAQVITIMGLGAGFFLYMLTVNLHHSPVAVRYPAMMRKILISPHTHHLHHSLDRQRDNKNYGVIFSVWDRWCKTYQE